MADVTCLGTINMDIMAYVDKFPENDSEVLVKRLLYVPGGSAANVAAGICRLGRTASVIGAAGSDDFGNQITNALKREGIDTSGLARLEGSSGTIFIPVDRNGGRRIFNWSDAPSRFSRKHVNTELIKNARFLYLCGIAGEEAPEACEYAAECAKQNGKTVVFDPTIIAYYKLDKIRKIIENTDILLVNRTEAEMLGGEDALSEICKCIILKLGPDGCVVISEGKRTEIDSCKVNAVDTTGAGDCFAAALIVKLLEGKDIIEAARFANKAAAISCTKEGAMATPALKETEEFRF